MGEIYSTNFDFPVQKISESEKDKKWFEKCVEAGIRIANYLKTSNNRYEEKLSNFKLVNNIIDQKEVERALNPFNIKYKDLPVNYRNYPLINPVLDLLIGEARKRPYNYMVTVVNRDAITEKINKRNEELKQFLYEIIIDPNLTEDQINKKLQEFGNYLKYDFKTAYEQLGNQILQYFEKSSDLNEVFIRGMLNLLIYGDEIYVVEIVNGEPVLRIGNPLEMVFIKNNSTWKVEESDIIVEETYLSKGSVIDKYYDYLTDDQISLIESGFSKYVNNATRVDHDILNKPIEIVDDVVQLIDSGYTDTQGNIKVTRVVWSGFRKIGIVTYYNDDMEQERVLVHETYKPDKSKGETVKWVWIREWYEGTKIGDFYVKCEPCQIQIRNLDNPSICNPGIVGTTLDSFVNGITLPLVSKSKDLQYAYNLYMAKLELALKKFKGRIGKLPLHLVPDKWSIDKWMYYAEYLGWAVEDAFAESSKPVFQGKPAGTMQPNSPVIDLSTGNEIQMYVTLLEFIERRFQDITGITPQRKGAISASETVGGVERSVLQSSNITENYFAIHADTRKRAMNILLEATKIAWKNKSIVKEYVLDDGTRNVLMFDYETFNSASYGVVLTDSTKEMIALDAIRRLSQAMIQNGASISMVAKLQTIDNIGELIRKIEEYEAQIQKMREEEVARQEKLAQMGIQEKENERMFLAQEKQKDRDLELLIARLNSETQIARAQLQTYIGRQDVDLNDNGVPDPLELAKVSNNKIDIEVKKYLKEKELELKKIESKRKLDLEEKKLQLEKQKMKQEKELKEKEFEVALKNKVPGEK